MTASLRHILLLLAAFLLAGCCVEPLPVPTKEETGIRLTVRCDRPGMTKTDPEEKMGEAGYNENLIQSVDFLFYAGDTPGDDTDALYHIRKELNVATQASLWEASFDLVIKKDIVELIFTEENGYQGTVYALVNFESTFIEDLAQTSRNDLNARRIVTDFAGNESNYVQPSLLMDGRAVISYDENATPNATGEINISRLASKLSIALNVVDSIVLKHDESTQGLDEYWTPVKNSIRVYLVDGVKSVLLGGADPEPEYFSYKADANKRAFIKDNGNPYLATETVTEGGKQKIYYNTWPMYSYPASWSTGLPDHSQIDYTGGLPPEPPYFKLEMDWRREPRNGYSYDRRKYYYKVFMPFNEFKRNNWYGFYLDVSILGSETDEGKAVLNPTCYLLDWQNKSLAINKYATISKARYLSLDKKNWDVNNLASLSIPFTSSHNVMVVENSVTATRPFYGELKDHPLNKYDTKLHAWVKDGGNGSYYLDYTGQTSGNEQYEPYGWLSNTSTSIVLNHPLQNDFTQEDFDYSPYTIEFDIIHTDLADDPESHTYDQYLQHVKIIQYPGIYIQKLRNRDTEIVATGNSYNPYGYKTGSAPWFEYPWGYVFVNGGRFVRYDTMPKGTSPNDPFYKLTTDNAKREFQWQTVWYTGGSKDMFDIHVTVLPENLPNNLSFVIGDPREDSVNNLDDPVRYPNLATYTVDGKNAEEIWNNLTILEKIRSGSEEYKETSPGVYQRIGFNVADALYGDEPRRPLKWYYPTEKSTRTENMLAPSYRVASKFGGTEYGGSYFKDLSKEYAEYRCAGYQEDGFPAGRWRLPTKAEIHFIAQLSAKKAFEFLFGDTVYWSANGAVQVNKGNVTNSSATTALLRCVYDSWYWDKVDGLEGDPRHDPEVFVWGDKER